jgi:hypothetical protein
MTDLKLLLGCLFITTTAYAAELSVVPVPFGGLEPAHESVSNPAYREGLPKHLRSWHVRRSPNCGLIGQVTISGLPANGSYTARIRIHEVLTKDLLPPGEDKSDREWFHAMGLIKPDAPLRALRHEHIWTINQDPITLTITLPPVKGELHRSSLEILAADGTVIHTSAPAEVYAANSSSGYRGYNRTAWIASSDKTADYRLRQVAQISSAERITELPSDWRHFAGTQALWVDETTAISNQLYQRYILSGHWIYGRASSISDVGSRLGLASDTTIFTGGIAALEESGEHRSQQPTTLNLNQLKVYGSDDETYPLENAGALFERIKAKYLTYTLLSGGLYAAGATILFPLLFLRLGASRRIELWWKCPLVIAGYSVVVLLIGWTVIQPHAPIADVTEYRMGYGDWPEVYSHVNASALRFGHHAFGWRTPPESRNILINGDSPAQLHTEGDSLPGSVTYNRVPRGLKIVTDSSCFLPLSQPFRAELRDGSIHVTSSRAVRNVHLALRGDDWLELGDFKVGETIRTPDAIHATEIKGIPHALENALRVGAEEQISLAPPTPSTAKPCKNCDKIHQSSSTPGAKLISGSVILIAVDEADQPFVQGIDPEARTEGRVVWISQVPLGRPSLAGKEVQP